MARTTEEEEALFLAMSFWFSFAVCPTERTNRRENRDTRKERKKKEGKKQPQTHSPLFKAERKHKRKELVSLSLSTHHGEPRSGGNLERVTREERERGAFLIVCCGVFLSLFFLFYSLKEARAKTSVLEILFLSTRDSLSEEEGVCGSNHPKRE